MIYPKLLRGLPALALPLSLLVTPSPATAAPTATACTMDLGSVTSQGVVQYGTVTATPLNTAEPVDPTFTQVSAGWGAYSAIGLSVDDERRTARNQFYGLSNGTVRRWVINSFGWTPTGQTGGFSAVKTWALLGQSTTYDTFLATTRGGALYTVRLPLTKTMTPVVKQVRSGTWQAFDYLIAQRCGQVSTLLTAIDKDTGAAYLYAMSHANGPSTVIKLLGKLPGTYTDPIYFLRTNGTYLRGE